MFVLPCKKKSSNIGRIADLFFKNTKARMAQVCIEIQKLEWHRSAREETVFPDRVLTPHLGSLRSQDIQYNGSELSCFDRPQLHEYAHRACCQCRRDSVQTCGKFSREVPLGGLEVHRSWSSKNWSWFIHLTARWLCWVFWLKLILLNYSPPSPVGLGVSSLLRIKKEISISLKF